MAGGIETALRSRPLNDTASVAIRDIGTWVAQTILPRHKAPAGHSLLIPPFRPDLTPEDAAAYIRRALNEWLPAEVARLLTAEAEFAGASQGGMPALAVARALERLLLREHFSPAALGVLLDAAWLSPKYAYPAHLEIFREIVLALLGRTAAPTPSVLPAAPVAGGFADALGRAAVVSSEESDELHVPLDQAQAVEVLKPHPVHLRSAVVTMDGRLWQSARFQSGPETAIVYRPIERLRIDFTSEHARLAVPWPDAQAEWPGAVHLPVSIELFGRQWRGHAWEKNADRTCLHLEFSGVLPASEGREKPHPRVRPASAEMAWSEVAQALAAGAPDSIDQLRREDLIPLAYALERLARCLLRPWAPSREDLERSLMSIRYLHGAVAPVYGSIPWRVLPAPARTALRKRCGDAALADFLSDTFHGAVEPARTWPPRAA